MNQENTQIKVMLEAEKQEFLAVLSHELRTPMSAVKGYLAMVLDGDAGEVNEKMRKFISTAFVANERTIKLVESMMKVVALQEDQMKFHLQKVDLVQSAQILMHDFEVPAKEKGLELIYQKPEHEFLVLADPDRAREVLLNLISNAVKFTKKGAVTIGFREIDENERHLAAVVVSDTGLGIAPEYQSKIFQVFTKENVSLANQEKGAGLGLFLASKLAQAQKGKVWLEKSELDEGSTFCAAFPVFKN